MFLPISIVSSDNATFRPDQDHVGLFEVEILRKNPRYEAIWKRLTPSQQEHHKLVLQLGNLQLPLDPTYQIPTHPSFHAPTPGSVTAPIIANQSPPARLLRARGRSQEISIELQSLSSNYSSDEENDIDSSGANEEDDDDEIELVFEDDESDQSEVAVTFDPPVAEGAPTTELVFAGYEVEIFVEDQEAIGESDMLEIHLIAPAGMPRLQTICSFGYVRISSTRRWLLSNGEQDTQLYQLALTNNMNRLTLYMNTKVLQEQLQSNNPLQSRSSFFNFLEQERVHGEWRCNNWTDQEVELFFKTLRNAPALSFSSEVQAESEKACSHDPTSEPYRIQWKPMVVSPIQLLNHNGPIYAHTQHQRFLITPSADLYLKSTIVDNRTLQPSVYPLQVNFRGVCLAHPPGIGKRKMTMNMMQCSGVTCENAKILLVCFESQRTAWTTYLNQIHIVSWESLHGWLKEIPVTEDYYGYFRRIASELQYFPKSIDSELFRLLCTHWDYIILDDVVHGIASQNKKSDSKRSETITWVDNNGATREQPWYDGSYPLYHFLQNIPAPRLIATARDFRPSSAKEVLAMGGLLQKFGDAPLLQRFKHSTPSPLLAHLMTQNVLGFQKRSILERDLPSQLILHVAELEITQYEKMAQTDLRHRYTVDNTSVDFDHVPLPSLAIMVTVSSAERMMAHRDFYENKVIHTVESVHRKLQHKFATEAYQCPLLNRDQQLLQTHFSSPSVLPAPQQTHLRQLLETQSNLVTEFTCSMCFEKEPKKNYDYAVTKCGHLVCWTCLSPWIVHHRWKEDNQNYQVPCMACRIPLKDEDIFRYRSTNTLNFVPDETTRPYFAALERQHKRIALSKDSSYHLQPVYSAKMMYLLRFLRQKQNGNKRVVLFTSHVELSNRVNEILEQERFEVLKYKGRLSQRRKIQDTFQKKRHGGMIIMSLNVESKYDTMDLSQSVDTIIFLDNCYETTMKQEVIENSIIGRIHRANRTRPLQVLRMILKGSQEEVIHQAYLKRD